MTHPNRRADRARDGIRSVLVATDFSDGAGTVVLAVDASRRSFQAAPFALIMVLMCVSVGKDLRTDGLVERRRRADDLLAKLVESEYREDRPPEQDPPDRQ
ncbi:hypothetical protein E1181_15515 [Saccharopolyspora terrae]|uniref:Uncharacterized protein n=1 Tax=Saccharopolyspora terrae TaxID=2530384 RepID=A0A4R4VSK2_9PSEU|nr:hypothetical protein [Saccharopolyspora terrae]TDD05325.1 hypothetical protein E1181_15515 [Saccharopolyspora terrae]